MFVVANRRTVSSTTYDGVVFSTGYTTIAEYRPDLGSTPTCNATTGGDSGGPVYFGDADRPGYVVGYGIHQGRGIYNGKCTHRFTEFAGVIKRYPAAKVG